VLATGSNLVLRTKNRQSRHLHVPGRAARYVQRGHYRTRRSRVAAGRSDQRRHDDHRCADSSERDRPHRGHSRPPAQGSGTDVSLSAENLTRSPANGNLSELLVQLPGAARGANGVVHINGDHGDINYIVDGVPIPQELNRTVGGEFDSNNLAFVEALQGAYPAQYENALPRSSTSNTRNGNGPAGFTGDVQGGSYSYLDSTLGYHAPIGTGNIDLAVRNERGDRGLDPPGFDSPHNDYSNANQFLRYHAAARKRTSSPDGQPFVPYLPIRPTAPGRAGLDRR